MKELEQDLLKRVKNSDKDAFHQLFSNFYDTLFRFVVYKVKDSDLAKDISQKIFLRVWKKRASLVPQKSFFSLIAHIPTNLCYDYFRPSAVREHHEFHDYSNNQSFLADFDKLNKFKIVAITRVLNYDLTANWVFIRSKLYKHRQYVC